MWVELKEQLWVKLVITAPFVHWKVGMGMSTWVTRFGYQYSLNLFLWKKKIQVYMYIGLDAVM